MTTMMITMMMTMMNDDDIIIIMIIKVFSIVNNYFKLYITTTVKVIKSLFFTLSRSSTATRRGGRWSCLRIYCRSRRRCRYRRQKSEQKQK